MRHKILAIIVLCLTLATGFASAQDDASYTLTANIAPTQEIDEQVVLRQILDDIGVTEAEIMQFGIILDGVGEPYIQYIQENSERLANVTPENYVEVVGDFFDNFIQPMIGDIRTEAANFFTEDQYAKLTILAYQLAETCSVNTIDAGETVQSTPVGDVVQLFLLPDVVSLTEEQWVELAAMQKEVLIDLTSIDFLTKSDNAELFAEHEALFEEFSKAETDEKKAVIQEKMSKVTKQISALTQERVGNAFAKMQTKLNTLLTAEQKAKLAQIKADIPDYLKQAMGGVTTNDNTDADESPAAWRPSANSWVPGMGAPKEQPLRETPSTRQPQNGRRFPGTE
ncbi:MAG: hypothetical protein FWD31_09775 [Planctomycetaceae bacterium]|nr:hypothetical protein [Planctomycetaceae bacterium]